MKTVIVSLLFFFTLNSHAHKLKCEIYDLATGSNLAESGAFDIIDFNLKEPMYMYLGNELIEAYFSFYYLDDTKKNLVFEVRIEEVSVSFTEKFIVPVMKYPPNVFFELGHVYTELTGIGDNTKTSCSFYREEAQD